MEKNAEAEKAGIENEAADTKNFVFDHSSGASELTGNYEVVQRGLLLGHSLMLSDSTIQNPQ